MEPNYVANFTLERTVDGSTFVGLLDYGLDVLIRRKVRLVNVKCHEPSTPAGAAARDFVDGLVRGRRLRCKTLRDQYRKWNTVLAVLYAKENGGGWTNVNDVLAARMMGGGGAGLD
jgi:endonuclease YncB( thermonuclease family)